MLKLIQFLEKPIGTLSKYLGWCSQFVLLAIMFFTTADVFGRYVLSRPIFGSYELSEFMLVIMIMSGLAYTQAKGRHVSVGVLVDRFPVKSQAALDSFFSFVGLLIMCILVWASFDHFISVWRKGGISEILHVPQWPFRFLVPVGFSALALEFLLKCLRSVALLKGKGI